MDPSMVAAPRFGQCLSAFAISATTTGLIHRWGRQCHRAAVPLDPSQSLRRNPWERLLHRVLEFVPLQSSASGDRISAGAHCARVLAPILGWTREELRHLGAPASAQSGEGMEGSPSRIASRNCR